MSAQIAALSVSLTARNLPSGLNFTHSGPVDAHPANRSPFGIREMAGNAWELTATVLDGRDQAVVCGGSFDNPYRAGQVSSKGACRRRGASATVGFRCARDLP